MSYTNKARVQNYLMITIADSFASQITEWITAIQKFIDNYCNTTFEQESATYKLYDGSGNNTLLIDDLITLTKIEILDEDGNVDYTIDDTIEYRLYPANKTPKTRIVLEGTNSPIPYFIRGKQNVKVTGTFGYSATVPEDIQFVATKLVAGIIEEKNAMITGEMKSERLGEYDITLQDVDKMANHLGIYAILDRYRVLQSAAV